MGNESGEWIMHGLEWDNPACIHTVEKAIEHINDVGFLPLFIFMDHTSFGLKFRIGLSPRRS